MTTERQRLANKANAQKSTGPRSAAGRRRSALNATRHGLTTSPDWGSVRFWFRVILADPSAEPNLLDMDPLRRAALRLAEAEALRDRAIRAEEPHLAEMAERSLTRGNRSILELTELDITDPEVPALMIERSDDTNWREGLRILLHSSPNRPVGLRHTLKQLNRYRRQAEARQHKSLREWTRVTLNRRKTKRTQFQS
jgi:hypothetical protein